MRHTNLHVSQKYSHGCRCTTGDIVVFEKCTALTSLNLEYCYELTGKAKEHFSPSGTPDSHRKQVLNSHRAQPSYHGPSNQPPALLCGLVVCVRVYDHLVCSDVP